MGVAAGHPLGRTAVPRHQPVVAVTVAQSACRVATLTQANLRRDVGGPDHHHLVLVGQHLVEAGGLVAVLAHERHPLSTTAARNSSWVPALTSSTSCTKSVPRTPFAMSSSVVGLPGTPPHRRSKPPVRHFGGLVPPVAVERLASLEVHAVDVAGPALPPARADVPDVDHLGPTAAARGAHVERAPAGRTSPACAAPGPSRGAPCTRTGPGR